MTHEELQEYYFYFGMPGINQGKTKIRPWYLRHVQSFQTSLESMSTEIGIPMKPPEMAQIFDMSGPVRKFEINGIWLDYEEEVSNIEFFFRGGGKHSNGALNSNSPTYSTMYKWYNAFTKKYEDNCISMPIVQMYTVLQASIPGFQLNIVPKIPYTYNNKGEVAGMDADDDLLDIGSFNVALTSINMEYTPNPGELRYSLTLIERREMGKFKIDDIKWDG